MKKKILKTISIMYAILTILTLPSFAAEKTAWNENDVYDPGEHYYELMIRCAEDGSDTAMRCGAKYEAYRNQKIEESNMEFATTNFFENNDPDIVYAKLLTTLAAMNWNENDFDLFARLIYAEAGSNWLPDELQLYVGSVVLNRIVNEKFPDTLYDVVYQRGQYAPTWNGSIRKKADERTIENAKQLVEEGSVCPINCVWQAEFRQGKSVYWKYKDTVRGSTTYICAS